MKKKQLEILLERIESFDHPSLKHEQYSTPASVAADLLFLAYMHDDLGVVCDLGCGTGILAVGAALLGAKSIGVDIDPFALASAKTNAKKLDAEVEFILGDVKDLEFKGIDTVVMNPPFGAQKSSQGDRPFLKKAMHMAKTIYTINNAGSEGFIQRFIKPCKVQEIYHIPFRLKRSFEFHRESCKTINVELYRITCCNP